MNFSFELSGALLTGNISPEGITWMSTVMWAIFGWFTMIRMFAIAAIIVLMVISRWKVFTKAGLPGWGIFIPFYNRYLMFKLGGRSGRNFLWILIPPVFVILMIINYFNIAKRFWKPLIYGLGIRFLKVIFIPILAFDNSKYLGKKGIAKPAIKAIPAKTTAAKPATPAKKVIAKKPAIKTPIKKAPVNNRAKASTTKAPAKIAAKVPTAKAPIKKVKTLKKI